jgi:transcriptional regulator with XRE-family HTH domain
MARDDTIFSLCYPVRMARKQRSTAKDAPDWYLRQWMLTLKVTQAKLGRLADIPKATMNAIYHGKTAYYRDLLNTLANALNIEPFELLLPPDRAMEIRSYNRAVSLAAENRLAYRSQPIDFDDLSKIKRNRIEG